MVETFKYDELPRVFFSLKNNNCAENEKDTENQENIEKTYTKDQLPMDELDGAFFSPNEVALDLESLPFIEDHKLEINQKSGKRFNVTFSDEKIKFHKNSLILIEVKNSFPYFNKDKENEEKKINKEANITNEQETELELDTKALTKELFIALKKAEVFYQKYKENYSEMNNVQLLFFYDSVRKKDMKK